MRLPDWAATNYRSSAPESPFSQLVTGVVTAAESNGRGLFTDMLLDGLTGSSADICGRITPASLYSHVDKPLPLEQRPIYKANVQTFVTLRQVAPKVPLETLRRLPKYFPDPTDIFSLDSVV